MSSAPRSNEQATGTPRAATVDLKLEVVILPVSDVDRAKTVTTVFLRKRHAEPAELAHVLPDFFRVADRIVAHFS